MTRPRAVTSVGLEVDFPVDDIEVGLDEGTLFIQAKRRLDFDLQGFLRNAKPEKVRVHNHLLGGGFGRRLEVDFVAQAVAIAKHGRVTARPAHPHRVPVDAHV